MLHPLGHDPQAVPDDEDPGGTGTRWLVSTRMRSPDPWLRQALINEATRRWGPRNGGQDDGR
jgi:hypothetical protein